MVAQGLWGGWNHPEQNHGGGEFAPSGKRRPLCEEGVRERGAGARGHTWHSQFCVSEVLPAMYTRKSQELMCSYDTILSASLCSRALPDPHLGLGLNFLLSQMEVTTQIVVR